MKKETKIWGTVWEALVALRGIDKYLLRTE